MLGGRGATAIATFVVGASLLWWFSAPASAGYISYSEASRYLPYGDSISYSSRGGGERNVVVVRRDTDTHRYTELITISDQAPILPALSLPLEPTLRHCPLLAVYVVGCTANGSPHAWLQSVWIELGPGDDSVDIRALPYGIQTKFILRGGTGGADVLIGGEAQDSIYGGPGIDTMSGRGGDDDFYSFDHARDVIASCGNGFDTVTADEIDDVAADCEDVTRY